VEDEGVGGNEDFYSRYLRFLIMLHNFHVHAKDEAIADNERLKNK
jgi:hypothetical protein